MTQTMETYRGVVYPWHIDQIGHMNVQFYTARFDEATWHFFAALGITPAYLKNNGRGMAAVDQHTQYKQELHAGALINIGSELLEMKSKTVRFRHRMYNSETGEEVAVTELVGVHMDTTARRSVAIPPEILERAQRYSPAGPKS
jgi:acyl-CoA thioester hydrolase